MTRLEEIGKRLGNQSGRIAVDADDLRDLLVVATAADALTEPTRPIRGIGACCIYCGQEVLNEGHASECPWLQFAAALDALEKPADG